MPDAPGLELIRGEIEEDHPGAVLATSFDHGQASLVVDPGAGTRGSALAARGARPGLRLPVLPACRGLPPGPATLWNPLRVAQSRQGRALRVKAMLADPALTQEGGELPEIDSCVELFATAEFQEREVFDFFGIVFRGPPGPDPNPPARRLRRMAPASRFSHRWRAGDLHLQRARKWLSSSADEITTEVMTVNIGPHHPATHGVLRLIVELEGEVVRGGEAGDRLRPHRDRKVLRGQELLEGHPLRRADGLRLLLLPDGGLLRRGRAAGRARDPAPGQDTCARSSSS